MIALGKKLRKDRRSYTSNHALAEIIRGTTEESFFRQRRLLGHIAEIGMRIDWDSPSYKHQLAFGLSGGFSSDSTYLRQIFNLIVSSTSYSEFRFHLDNSELSGEFDFLTSTTSLDEKFRTDIVNPIPRIFKQLTNAGERRQVEAMFGANNRVLEAQIFQEALRVGEAYGIDIAELLPHYTGSLDVYLLCSAAFNTEKLVRVRAWAKNDFADLSHLLYLQNPSCAIVTNDKMLQRLVTRPYPKQVLGVSRYVDRI